MKRKCGFRTSAVSDRDRRQRRQEQAAGLGITKLPAVLHHSMWTLHADVQICSFMRQIFVTLTSLAVLSVLLAFAATVGCRGRSLGGALNCGICRRVLRDASLLLTAQLTIAPYAPDVQSPRCANMGFPSSRPTLLLLSAAVPLGTNLHILNTLSCRPCVCHYLFQPF